VPRYGVSSRPLSFAGTESLVFLGPAVGPGDFCPLVGWLLQRQEEEN
jgi:hypothetical protein